MYMKDWSFAAILKPFFKGIDFPGKHLRLEDCSKVAPD